MSYYSSNHESPLEETPQEITAAQAEYARAESIGRVGWCLIYLDVDGSLRRHLFYEFQNSLRAFRFKRLSALCIARNGVILVTRKGGA